MLEVRNLGMRFNQEYLFRDVNLTLLPEKCYGIVGANGTGKSTFLRMLAGEDLHGEGSIDKPNKVSRGILKQDHFRYENDRVIDVVLKGNQELWDALAEKEILLQRSRLTDTQGYRLGALEEIILHHDGYSAETEAQALLAGLGLAEKYFYEPLSVLSGGYKLRVLLAQVLFQKPDVMLLDEPTNHLDIISISWLEDFLKAQFKGLLVFVSHDREFLNNLPTHILDIDYGTITAYVGNYNKFEINKEQTLMQKQSEVQHKERQIAVMQDYVDRFRASANRSKQAQSRIKMIDKIELPELKASSALKPHFNFSPKTKSGKAVLKVEKITKQFDERVLLKNVSFSLQRGEKCAVIGANGIGKSTLLKILLDEVSAEQGQHQWNENVSIGYFAQDYRTQLSENITAWQWMENKVSASAQEIRNVLGQVLFSGKEADKKLSMLSGGESARLVLASLILQRHNVLILDEPTNHLDLESINSLVESLVKYTGTVLFVSHQRYFIDKIATRILALTEHKGAQNYLGNYHDYLEQYGKDYLARS